MQNNLNEIDHFVILMLENRSFDHMLGYLSLNGKRPDVDGLTGEEFNDFQDQRFFVHHLEQRTFDPDPCHSLDCVREQLAGNNNGFIANFARKGIPNPQSILGYYDERDLPVYDHLAREFTLCNRWFCSVPGETQPNRVFALAGHSDGKSKNMAPRRLFKGPPVFSFLPEQVEWQYYSHDIASLRFFKGYLIELRRIRKFREFIARAEAGRLPHISWIDPNFGFPLPELVQTAGISEEELETLFDFRDIFNRQNDDHPPVDVGRTQDLVSRIYNALLRGGKSQWERTLFIITYDEHGGFYDHVCPVGIPVEDDRPAFRQYGPRVPALIVSPWVARQAASNIIFDHTSILKTILLRFCKDQDGCIPHMSRRVDAANSLGLLLTEPAPRSDCTPAAEIPFLIEEEALQPGEGPSRPAAGPSELQLSMLGLAGKALGNGVPPDRL